MQTYSVIELAEAAGLPVRTVRYYQAGGLLSRAQRVGRSLQYGEKHLHRLKQIAEMQASGLKLGTIRDMLDGGGLGKAPVVALLGAGPSGERWFADAERVFTVTELAELLGDRYFDLLEPLERTGHLERRTGDGPTTWHCPDLPLLRSALQLSDIGTDIELTARARDLLRRRVRRLAEDLVQMWEKESGEQSGGDADTALPENLELVRSVAWQTAAYMMAQETDRAVRTFAERAASKDRPGHVGGAGEPVSADPMS